MRMIASAFAALFLTFALAACGTHKPAPPTATVASGEKVQISQASYNAYINYKQWVMPKSYSRPVGDGYFAITKDGRGWGITGCPDTFCDVGTLKPEDAIRECSNRNGGAPCLVFAHQQNIVVPYEIVQ
jgi:hypothetical protein